MIENLNREMVLKFAQSPKRPDDYDEHHDAMTKEYNEKFSKLHLFVNFRRIRNCIDQFLTGFNNQILAVKINRKGIDKTLFDLIFIQMRRGTELLTLELVVALPDNTPIFACGMPDFKNWSKNE